MSYLLDTCVLSELSKSDPSPQLAEWFEKIPEDELYVSVLTLGEIRYGIGKLPDGRRKNDLFQWFETLEAVYESSALGVSREIALRWGAERARLAGKGIQVPVIDGLIAASALHHSLYLVSRNVKDFSAFEVDVINPWAV